MKTGREAEIKERKKDGGRSHKDFPPKKIIMYYNRWLPRIFCVSVFRQNQEYHMIHVHDGAYSPWLPLSREDGTVCAPDGVNAVTASRES